eukprot:GSMAST32.ASY1.ANO1.1910.1 assembled CDS
MYRFGTIHKIPLLCRVNGIRCVSIIPPPHQGDFFDLDLHLKKNEAKGDNEDIQYTKEVSGPGPHVRYELRKTLIAKKEGREILTDPLYNKGTAFRHGERDRLGLRGLLPPRRFTMKAQTPLRKHIFLNEIHDRNETLYHRVLVDNIKELAPIVYTPTVGEACQNFGIQFRRPRGMYFCTLDRMNMASMMHNWPSKDVQVVVVTDGSRILGLGDLGANGMAIPVGKLALYCAAGGIAPHRVLPVQLDFGTNNEELLQDPFYLGLKHTRVTGDEYYELLDEFVSAVFNRYPNAFLQFEDFSSDKAQIILDRYRSERLVFNDDIQGTGAVAIAGIMSALRCTGRSVTSLKDQRILIAGAGSAGIGVAEALMNAMKQQGLKEHEAVEQFVVCDVNGMSLSDAMKEHKPSILLGLSAQGGLFDKSIIKTMHHNTERPIIFPLSNPTSKAECSAADAYNWTKGSCIFASGSPFDPVKMKNGTIMTPSQCNNMFIFPGLGLGATLSGAKRCSDKMVYSCAVACAESVSEDELNKGMVFPDLDRIREVSLNVGTATVTAAAKEGLVTKMSSDDVLNCREILARKMYDPMYVPITDNVYNVKL